MQPEPVLILTGSVKDTAIYRMPTRETYGEGEFRFRDDYSVFDWVHGEGGRPMPDEIPGKGVAQCLIGAYFFEQAGKSGIIRTTYKGLVDPASHSILPAGQPVSTNRMGIKVVQVVNPEHMEDPATGVPSYREYRQEPQLGCAVVPIEFIFRFGLPKGSSAFRRMKEGKAKPEFFGLAAVPKGDQPIWFGEPRMDYSTKFDPRGDLYDLGREWYMQSAGMDGLELYQIEAVTANVARMMGREYERIGMKLWDGKLEFVFDPFVSGAERTISLGDVPGALDEVRVLVGGQQRSKQFVRDVYETSQPEWVAACRKEEDAGGDWQNRVVSQGLVPRRLSSAELDLASGLYTSVANALWGREVIPGAPSMEQIDRDFKKFQEMAGK